MRNKLFISFLAFAGISFAIYLTISTFYDTLEGEYGSIEMYAPAASGGEMKPYKPNNRSLGSSSSGSFGLSDPLAPSLYKPNNRTPRNNQNYTYSNDGYLTDPPIVGSNGNHANSNTPIGANPGLILIPGSSGRATGGGGTSNDNMAYGGSNMGNYSNSNNSNYRGLPSDQEYKPFAGNEVGAPDPGGNFDDSCDDDIIFIPVPDGLHFMISLSFLYALLKFFRL